MIMKTCLKTLDFVVAAAAHYYYYFTLVDMLCIYGLAIYTVHTSIAH